MKTKLSTLRDIELQKLLNRGNSQAFEEIFNRYWRRLYAYAYKIYNDEKTCEDIVQEVFISLWEKSKETNILYLEGYLLKSVKYKIANHIRSLKFTENHLDLLQEIPNPSSNMDMEYQELEDQLFQEINRLPPKCREVFRLSRLEHRTNQEIAHKLNLSVRTVEKHISNALRQLRTTIDEPHYSLLITAMFLECYIN